MTDSRRRAPSRSASPARREGTGLRELPNRRPPRKVTLQSSRITPMVTPMSHVASRGRTPTTENSLDRRGVVGAFLLALLAGGMAAWSCYGWADPLVDFGRECYVPWQMLNGARLYRDIAYFNGPLSPCVNAAVFAVLGPSLRSVWMANAVVLLIIAGMLWTLLRFIVDRACAVGVPRVLLAVVRLWQLCQHVELQLSRPYSHEMTHGILLALVAMLAARQWIVTARRRSRRPWVWRWGSSF